MTRDRLPPFGLALPGLSCRWCLTLGEVAGERARSAARLRAQLGEHDLAVLNPWPSCGC